MFPHYLHNRKPSHFLSPHVRVSLTLSLTLHALNPYNLGGGSPYTLCIPAVTKLKVPTLFDPLYYEDLGSPYTFSSPTVLRQETPYFFSSPTVLRPEGPAIFPSLRS